MTFVPILMLLASCVADSTKHRAMGASELAGIDCAALELIARASSRFTIGEERTAECLAVLAGAEDFLLDPGDEPEARRVHARAASALTEVAYFARSDEAVRLASSTLDALEHEPRDVVAAAWAGQALRAAEQAELRLDRRAEREIVELAERVPLGAPTLELAAAHAIRGLLGSPSEGDERMRAVGDELLRRDLGSDLEAIWLASVGFYQHGGSGWERWNERLESLVVAQAKRWTGPRYRQKGFPSRDPALLVLILDLYYRYSAVAGAR